MKWSPQQQKALDAVNRWLKTRDKQVFYLAGYAGTGKTTLARHFAAGLGDHVLFGAFTGKAALRMRELGAYGASTIHSMIYHVRPRGTEHLERLKRELQENWSWQLEQEIEEEKKALKRPAFGLNKDSSVKRADLVVIDECSMIGRKLAEDLLSFGTPVLVLGDPAQLPPVRGQGYFTSRKPDVFLEEIHRQAKDDPILRLAHHLRQGKKLRPGEYGDSRVVKHSEWDNNIDLDVQTIVGRNVTRRKANRFFRKKHLGPQKSRFFEGDRLVCLANNHELGIMNGGIYLVREVLNEESDHTEMEIEDEALGNHLTVRASHDSLQSGTVSNWGDTEVDHFDYGYCLTAHRAQGSEFRNVLCYDESRFFRGSETQWAYTVATRAKDKLTWILP